MNQSSRAFVGITVGIISFVANVSPGNQVANGLAFGQAVQSKPNSFYGDIAQANIPEKSNLVCPKQNTNPPPNFLSIAVSTSDPSILAAVQPDDHVQIWNLASKDVVRKIPNQSSDSNAQQTAFRDKFTSMALTSDGKKVAGGLSSKKITIWDTSNGNQELTIPPFADRAYSLDFDSTNQFLASAFGMARKAIVFDLKQVQSSQQKLKGAEKLDKLIPNKDYFELIDNTIVDEVPKGQPKADSVFATVVKFSPDGKILATSGSDKNFKLWDKSSWKLIKTYDLKGSYQGAVQISFSPDSHTLATTIGIGKVGEVRLWDVKDPNNAKLVDTLGGFTGEVNSVAFSPSGQYLVAGDKAGLLRVWDLQSKTKKEVFHKCGNPLGVVDVSFYPNSNDSFISEGADGAIKFWTLDTTTPPPNNGSDPWKIILGVLLALYSLIGLYSLYKSHRSLIHLLENFTSKLNHLVLNGKSLSESFSCVNEVIDDIGENVEEISVDLCKLNEKVECKEYKDENTSIIVDFDAAPIAKDIRETSDSIFKLKERTQDIFAKTNKLFCDFEDDIPKGKQIITCFNPLYVTLMVLHTGLFLFGIWFLINGFKGSTPSLNQEQQATRGNAENRFDISS
jgi:WD40 repeat protein